MVKAKNPSREAMGSISGVTYCLVSRVSVSVGGMPEAMFLEVPVE